jgi:hypothetical protein
VAPFERRPERLLPRLEVAAPLQHLQPGREPLEQLLGRERPQPRGRQLERKGQAVESLAERVHRFRALERQAERGGPLLEERERIVGAQRRDGEDVFGGELEPLAARDEHGQSIGGREQAYDHAGELGKEMLGVVEQDERPPPLEARRERLLDVDPFVFTDTERLGESGWRLPDVAHGREGHPPQPVEERVRRLGRRLERQARLADAARAQDCEHPHGRILEHCREALQLCLPAEERRCRDGEVRGRESLERREDAVA